MRFHGAQHAFRVKAYFEVGSERMPMARDRHVLVAIESYANCAAYMLYRQCRQGRRQGCLRLLSTETSAHPGTLDDHLAKWQIERERHHNLHRGRMLRRRSYQHRTVFTGFGPCRLRLEIKMFLAAQFERAV